MASWADQWRKDFPALQGPRGRGVTYLDSACMSLVPRAVLAAMERYYTDSPGCGGRSLYRWANAVGAGMEKTREDLGRYFGADPSHLVHLRNTTEAINTVARGLHLRRGDRVLITDQEHNSNLVIWQVLARTLGIRLEVLPLPEDRAFDVENFLDRLRSGIRLVSFFHASNMDGRTLPAREIVEIAHDAKALVLLDGSQSAPHERLDLTRMGVDFYALSFHKMLGPTGTGLLYGAPGLLERLEPLTVGGETVAWTEYQSHEPLDIPFRFEAGLQNYAGILGAGAAVRYLSQVDLDELRQHTIRLQRITEEMLADARVQVLGLPRPEERGSVFSFSLDGVHAHDVALFLDEGYGVMVRSGMHCVHSWYKARGLEGSARASYYLYNREQDARQLVEGVAELAQLTRRKVGGFAPSPPLQPRRESRSPTKGPRRAPRKG